MFANGSVDAAMESFPPSEEALQDTFVAVFTGPERPTPEEQEAIDGDGADAERRREEIARQRLKKEVELMVSREEFDQQAQYLRETNYVYADNAVNSRKGLKRCIACEPRGSTLL